MREFTGTMPAAPENLGLRFVRVHAVEMHTDSENLQLKSRS